MWMLLDRGLGRARTSRNAELLAYARWEYRGGDIVPLLVELRDGRRRGPDGARFLGGPWTWLLGRFRGKRPLVPMPSAPQCTEAC